MKRRSIILAAVCFSTLLSGTQVMAESKVADSSEYASVEDVVEEWMSAVSPDQLNEGTYESAVDSSSSMFPIEQCELTVKDGGMEAVLTMGGTGYLFVYPGSAEEAAAADEADYIPYVENEEGAQTYTLPVEALDQGVPCAAFSKKKEKWYDRTLVFRADSLPDDAFAEGYFMDAKALGLEDGSYSAEVTLEGGSGKASVGSPAKIVIEDGKTSATIQWSSSNYDYMIVDGEKLLPLNEELGIDGGSVFRIPVKSFDRPLTVLADTTAMSVPHEITYTLTFDSSTIAAE